MDYGLNGRGSIHDRGKRFSLLQTGHGAHPTFLGAYSIE
jgi:hypothetical protein